MSELNYKKVGDYYIPEIIIPEGNRPIGKFGRLHREYLKKHKPFIYDDLILSCQLWNYLAELNEQVQDRLKVIMEQMKEAEGVTEEMKNREQLHWVQCMNSIRNRAEEIVLHEMLYV